MYNFFKVYDNTLVRIKKDTPIQRFSFEEDKWIDDFDMLIIFTGEVDCVHIDEEEANNMIKNRV